MAPPNIDVKNEKDGVLTFNVALPDAVPESETRQQRSVLSKARRNSSSTLQDTSSRTWDSETRQSSVPSYIADADGGEKGQPIRTGTVDLELGDGGPPDGEAVTPQLSRPRSVHVNRVRSADDARAILDNFDTSQHNPRNWSNGRRWAGAITVSITAFISTLGSTMVVPGLRQMMASFGDTNFKVGVLVAGCYVLGMGFGPFVFAPVSELYGRQPAYIVSGTCFFLMSIGCALAPNLPSLIVMRFFMGCFGSVGPTLGVSSCADMFAPKERGRPLSMYALGPVAGPALGNMAGYWILLSGDWRWLYWTISIFAGVNWVLLLVLSQETFAVAIQKKLEYLALHPPPENANVVRSYLHGLKWMGLVAGDKAKEVFGNAFSRPARLLLFNPIATVSSLYYAYIFSILYLFVVSLSMAFGRAPYESPGLQSYRWPEATLALAYLPMAIGFFAACFTGAAFQDRIYKGMSKRNGDNGRPEYRLLLTQIGMIILPIGLFIFAWTTQAHTHWMGPMIGQLLTSYGTMLSFSTLQNAIVDMFSPYSAAALAGATAVRSALACVLSVYAAQMFQSLGWGWGGTVIALIAATGMPLPALMFKYGEKYRARFQFHG